MSNPDYLLYDVQVTTLSPLHIGTGGELMQEFDYAVHAGRTWRLNESVLLNAQDTDDPAVMELLMSAPPGQLLKRPNDFKLESAYFRYVIKGAPRSQKAGSILREQIKSADDRPYLPGSSLKGALRTALAWHAWQELGLQPERRKIDERRPKFAGRDYEHEIFGADPNHDLLRALLVGDSDPLAAECLMLANVKVLTPREESTPIEVEAIRPESVFHLSIKVDTQLFSTWAAQRKDFRLGGRKEWLDSLAAIQREHAQERIHNQHAWYSKRPGAAAIASFYGQLERLELAPNQFVVQLGWGGGWDSKTFGSRLQADGVFFDWLVTQPKLQLWKGKGPRRPGAPFPNSRRVAMRRQVDQGGNAQEVPAAPMGWVLVELTPKEVTYARDGLLDR